MLCFVAHQKNNRIYDYLFDYWNNSGSLFICFSNRELFMKLAFIPYRTIRNHEYYRIVTHGFIHADMTHLLVNMFTFWSFGLYIERTFRYMGFGSGGLSGFLFRGNDRGFAL